MNLRFALAFTSVLVTAGLGMGACGGGKNNSGSTSTASGGGSSGTGGGIPAELCLLHNCDTDLECKGCSEGRTTCKTDEHRCVACGEATTSGCPSGQVCSSFGDCVPMTLTCPTDGQGVPMITCAQTADCAACDPAHQVCDTTAHKCVACTDADTSQCQTTDTCIGGACSPKCPASCTSDGECSACGAPGHEAHACSAHKCSACSPTAGCAAGESCDVHGTCAMVCGAAGKAPGVCESDSDCGGCQGAATQCHQPVNGGDGTCGPSAPGCSDLGHGTVVLPAPWSSVTNACSTDADCASVGIDLNVGKLLRDLTGIDLIHDADIMYPMHACASVSLLDKSCGICVPCKVDSDCQDIDIDQVAGQAFGPIGSIAASYLLDQIFGPNDHEVHMYCETVAEGYGVCAPCPGILNACGVGAPPMSSGSCTGDHDVCVAGGALDTSCGACPLALCAIDPFCCTTGWDATCVGEVPQYCAEVCESCAHPRCEAGGPLDPACSPCVAAICQANPDCCSSGWDQSCIDGVPQYCEKVYLCKNLNQCEDVTDCTAPQGCRADYTCGPCMQDYDCGAGHTCDMASGDCQ